jgi:porphobilinogen deaminase
MVSDTEGARYIQRSQNSLIEQSKTCAKKLAYELLDIGGREILNQIRNTR